MSQLLAQAPAAPAPASGGASVDKDDEPQDDAGDEEEEEEEEEEEDDEEDEDEQQKDYAAMLRGMIRTLLDNKQLDRVVDIIQRSFRYYESIEYITPHTDLQVGPVGAVCRSTCPRVHRAVCLQRPRHCC